MSRMDAALARLTPEVPRRVVTSGAGADRTTYRDDRPEGHDAGYVRSTRCCENSKRDIPNSEAGGSRGNSARAPPCPRSSQDQPGRTAGTSRLGRNLGRAVALSELFRTRTMNRRRVRDATAVSRLMHSARAGSHHATVDLESVTIAYDVYDSDDPDPVPKQSCSSAVRRTARLVRDRPA